MESPTPTDLIDRHCPCLEGRVSLDLLSPLQLNASHEWIRLGPIGNAGDVNSDYQETQDFRIRLAMDVLNTVATCTGFDPRSNTTFWQSLLLRLSPLTPQDKRYAWAPFDHDLFSRFELEFDAAAYGSNNSLPRLEQLWMEIFAPNERFCRQRDQILAPILQETMRPIPPLRFRLVFLRTAVTKASWMDAVVRSSERLSQDVEVVMRDKVLDQKQLGSLPLATLVSPPMIALRDVTVCLPLIGKVGSYEFLHALILHQSSRVSRLVVECVGRVDFLDLSAVCSALPYAHALEELLLTNYIFRKSKAGPALSWVHYAWTNPRCLDGRSSLKRLMIDSHEYLTRHQSLNTEYPLQKAVGKALAKMYRYTSSVGADIWYPIGSTITAPSDLAAYSKPESIGTPTHTIPASSQLDVVVKMK